MAHQRLVATPSGSVAPLAAARGPAARSSLVAAALLLPTIALAIAFDYAPMVGSAILAFCAFSLCASAIYIVNDLLDLDSDRKHHSKRRRPFASGQLSAFARFGALRYFDLQFFGTDQIFAGHTKTRDFNRNWGGF